MLWWDWREETKGWVPLYSNHPMSCVSSSDHRRNLRSTTPVPCVHLYLLIPLELHQNQWWWDNYKRANINDISLNETWTAGSAVGVRWIRFPSFCQPRIHCWGLTVVPFHHVRGPKATTKKPEREQQGHWLSPSHYLRLPRDRPASSLTLQPPSLRQISMYWSSSKSVLTVR